MNLGLEAKRESQQINCTKNEVLHQGFIQQMWPNPQFHADLVTFTEEIVNMKFHFSWIDTYSQINMLH